MSVLKKFTTIKSDVKGKETGKLLFQQNTEPIRDTTGKSLDDSISVSERPEPLAPRGVSSSEAKSAPIHTPGNQLASKCISPWLALRVLYVCDQH